MRTGHARLMALVAAVFVAAATLPTAAAAKDAPSYPEGVSMQAVDGHRFDLVVPKAAEVQPPYSMLLVITGAGTAPSQFVPLATEGWVVVIPAQRFPGGNWATSETKDILDDVDAVAAACQVGKDRLHCLAIHDDRGFSTFVAYDKRQAFASMSFSTSEWSGVSRGKAPTAEARKHLGVLLMGEGVEPSKFGDPVKIAAGLAEKVRTAEYRRDESPFKPYFRYWLSVMDGRFKPGCDLSFDWIADSEPSAAKPGAKGAHQPAAKPALDVARAKGAPAFVYFWSADDAAKPEAKTLQNEVFLDEDVRAAARNLVAVKLDRAKYDAAFTAFGLKTTPAVVVVDSEFSATERFEGAMTAKALAKAFVKAAAPAKAK